MVLESIGVPVGVLATETYEINQFIGSQDMGFNRQRRIVICDLRRINFMNAPNGPVSTMPLPPGINDSHIAQYHTRAGIDANRAANGRVAAMIHHFAQPPLSPVLLQRLEPGEASRKYAAPEMMHIRDDHWRMAARPMIEQAVWAATGPLTEDDINPAPILPTELGCLNDGVVGPAKEITFTAPTRREAIRMFMDYAKDNNFGDGMALIPPTPELVDEMLAATTRDRNDVVGRVFLRGGAITIENLAINAVMSGVRPEAFPVVVAMGEALGHGWEENHGWWHIMTGNTHELAMVVSGPVVEEIGMSIGAGQAGAGNDVNNALGRTLRMLFRNIAHHIQPNLDISDRSWRQTEGVALVVAENVPATRAIGWPTHSESLGFGDGSSSVTLIGTNSGGAGLLTQFTGWQAAWTASALTNLLPLRAGTPPPGFAGLMDIGSAGMAMYAPAQARMLQAQHGSKEALIASRAHPMEVAQNDPTHPNHDPADPLGITGNLLSVRYPIIIGEDPSGAHRLLGSLHFATTFVNQKITGAALPGASAGISGPTAPSAPQNFTVGPLELDPATGTYSTKLTWDAPKSDGGRPITRYQVYYFHGHYDLAYRWLDVPGGADAREAVFTNLLPGMQYDFKVRARNDVYNARFYINAHGELNVNPAIFNERYAIFTEAESVQRMGGRGGWAMAAPVTPPGRMTVMNSNRYPQLQGQDGPGVKLYYGVHTRGPAGERFYGPNGQIWNYLGQRVDRAHVPVTSLSIGTATGAPAAALVSVGRNRDIQFTMLLNDGASLDDISWATSNAGLATVDADGLVTIKNMVGTVTLTLKDDYSGLSQSIIIRIS